MASKKFDTFPYGLDTRRSVLTSQPGTLAVLNNCHVNQGAEIEKRKAFVPLALVPGTFGLEAVANSLVVFGSNQLQGNTFLRSRYHNIATVGYNTGALGVAVGYTPPNGAYFNLTGLGGTGYNGNNLIITGTAPGGGGVGYPGVYVFFASVGPDETITDDTSGTVVVSPTTQLIIPVNYQQLFAPTGTAMASVIYSTVFGGKTFVIAAFTDGSLYAFYDTNLVTDFVAGVNDIDFTSPTTIAAGLVALINQTAGYVAVQNGASFTVSASAGNNYVPSVVTKTKLGNLTYNLISTAVAPYGQAGASGSFQIVAGQSAYAIGSLVGNSSNPTACSITINGGTLTGVVSNPTVGHFIFGSNAQATLLNIIAAINGTDGINTANAFVTAAIDITGYIINLTAISAGTSPNSYGTSTTNNAGPNWAFGASKLSGGNTNQIKYVKVGTTSLLNGGMVIPMGTTVAATAAAVAAGINANTGVGFTATSSGGIVTITSTTLDASLNNSVLSVTVIGAVMIGNCAFLLQGSGFQLEIKAGSTDLLNTPNTLTFSSASSTLALFNAAVVANINAYANTFAAYTDGALIYISQLVTSSSDAQITIAVTVTPSANKTGIVALAGQPVIQLAADTLVNFVAVALSSSDQFTFTTNYSTGPLPVAVSGGSGTYTYAWTITGIPQGVKAVVKGVASSTATVNLSFNATTSIVPFTAVATCVVSDTEGNNSNISINMVFPGYAG